MHRMQTAAEYVTHGNVVWYNIKVTKCTGGQQSGEKTSLVRPFSSSIKVLLGTKAGRFFFIAPDYLVRFCGPLKKHYRTTHRTEHTKNNSHCLCSIRVGANQQQQQQQKVGCDGLFTIIILSLALCVLHVTRSISWNVNKFELDAYFYNIFCVCCSSSIIAGFVANANKYIWIFF